MPDERRRLSVKLDTDVLIVIAEALSEQVHASLVFRIVFDADADGDKVVFKDVQVAEFSETDFFGA